MIYHKKPGEMTTQELERIMQIWLAANKDAHSFVPASYFIDNYEAVKKLIPQADIWLYKETGGQIIVGFAGITDGYLAGIFVEDSARGKGVGAALLQACLQTTTTLWLHVYVKNDRAVHFYQKNGFRIIAENINSDTQQAEYEMQFTVAE